MNAMSIYKNYKREKSVNVNICVYKNIITWKLYFFFTIFYLVSTSSLETTTETTNLNATGTISGEENQ